MSTQVVSIDRGPNWGGAFQSLAQGLLGIYQQQEQEKLRQQERQQQLADIADQRAWQQRQADQAWSRDQQQATQQYGPVLPPSINIGTPVPAGMGNFAGMRFTRAADELRKMYPQQEYTSPSAYVIGANGQPTPVPKELVSLLENSNTVPTFTGRTVGGAPLLGTSPTYHPNPAGGSVNDIVKGLIPKVISAEELKLRGDAYRVAVENQLAGMVYDALQAGVRPQDIGPDIAQRAENMVRGTVPPQFDAMLGGLQRADVNGSPYWYDPAIQQYKPASVEEKWWILKDKPSPAGIDIKLGAQGEAAQRGIARGVSGALTDQQVIEKVLPWVQQRAADPEELVLWAAKHGLTRDQLEILIQRVKTLEDQKPTADDADLVNSLK